MIGGIQPRKRHLDEPPRLCPGCGHPTARLKRMDHYLSLFFIPLFRVKQGERFLECDRCGMVSDEDGKSQGEFLPVRRAQNCGRCGRRVEDEFQFCPYCGERVS